jgi:hypothetical protein
MLESHFLSRFAVGKGVQCRRREGELKKAPFAKRKQPAQEEIEKCPQPR